ncbi:Sulfide:quinone oxidoreductase, Type II [hydrothermal vent metagenome]|uniref:Sulfide:quinone oxidoreductase, Type II n=1 Tax=hydrothermal vent metagenome TaxID=652676 RepID=A0A3B0ZL41_9ZZZZ
MAEETRHKVVIIGGGTGGIAVAAHLLKAVENLDVAIVEPADTHYYQPGWTFVGAGIIKAEKTARSMELVIPKGVKWIQDGVNAIDPDNKLLALASGGSLGYDFLIVAAGIKTDWDSIPGLKESLGKEGVVSNYDYQQAPKTWQTIQNFKGGTAIFTQPAPPFKCPGAAQKILYLADDAFRKSGVRAKSHLIFCSAAPGIFPVKKYAAALNKVIARKELDMRYQTKLVEIRAETKEAVFDKGGEQEVIKYDMIHVTPPMCAPDFLKGSAISDAGGWVDVDMHTLQHKKYSNIFGIGDCTNTPNSKTAAAIKGQTPVVASNVAAALNGQVGKAAYDGYASCPLVTGYGKLVLAEFDYNMQPKETFPFDQGRERRSMYYLKKYALPKFYWDVLLKGGDLNVGGS